MSRTYTKAKIFPLTRTAIQVLNPVSGPPSPFVTVFYLASAIAEKDEISCHENTTKNSKPYFQLSKDVLQKAREAFLYAYKEKKVYETCGIHTNKKKKQK